MDVWYCPSCNFAYDEDETALPGMEEIIPFDEIPLDWACPGCGVKKTEFKKKKKEKE